jgi:2-polyprenyl-6-methoxyphenol hydroxylase-like FAD-dependent oxidoreductase
VQPQRVLVIGGGIAGPARALLQSGLEADVVERAAVWSDPGTGMYLPANSVRALTTRTLQPTARTALRRLQRRCVQDPRSPRIAS